MFPPRTSRPRPPRARFYLYLFISLEHPLIKLLFICMLQWVFIVPLWSIVIILYIRRNLPQHQPPHTKVYFRTKPHSSTWTNCSILRALRSTLFICCDLQCFRHCTSSGFESIVLSFLPYSPLWCPSHWDFLDPWVFVLTSWRQTHPDQLDLPFQQHTKPAVQQVPNLFPFSVCWSRCRFSSVQFSWLHLRTCSTLSWTMSSRTLTFCFLECMHIE